MSTPSNASPDGSTPAPGQHPGTARHAGLQAGQAFLRGFTSSSSLSLVVAFGVAALICVLGSRFVTERWVVENGELLSRGDDDRDLELTRKALALKLNPAPLPALVLLGRVGGQSPCSAAQLDQVWPAADATLPAIVDLRLPDPTLYESLILADQLPTGWRAQPVVVLSLDELLVVRRSFLALENRPRLGLRSPLAGFELLRNKIQPVPMRWNYFVDNQSFLLSRGSMVASNLLAGHWRLDWANQSERHSARQAFSLAIRRAEAPDAMPNLLMLDNLLGRLQRGCSQPAILLLLADARLDTPAMQAVVPALADVAARHRAVFGRVNATSEMPAGLPADVWSALRSQSSALSGDPR